MLIATLPVRVSAPLTFGFKTMMDGCTVTVKLVEALAPPKSVIVTVTVSLPATP